MIENFNQSGNKTLAYSVFGFRQKGGPPKQIKYRDNDLVAQGEPLKRRFLYGNLLRVPQNSLAVLMKPNGRIEVYPPGEYIVRFETNYLDVLYVDKRNQSTAVRVEQASSQDGWEVRMAGRVNWRVEEPEEVIAKRNPHRDVETAAMNAIRSVAASLNHDRLVRVPGKSPMNDRNLAEVIRLRLEQDKNCAGIEIISFTFDYRTGDQRRTDIAEETLLKEAEAKLEGEKLHRELALADLREAVVLRRVATALKEAEAKDKIRLQEAENSTKVDKLLEPVQERKLKLKLREEESELNLRREEMQLNAKARAIESLANVMANMRTMNGIRTNMGGMGMDHFGEAMQIVAQSMTHDHYSLPNPSMDIPNKPLDPKSQLLAQVTEVMASGVVEEQVLRPIGEFFWQLEIAVFDTKLQFSYDLSNGSLRLYDIVVVTADGVEVAAPDTAWTEGLTLAEIVLKLTGTDEIGGD